MSEWEAKIAAIINETKNENVTSFAGVPSWLLVLMNKVLEDTGKGNLFEVWPNLEVYFHGGVNFEPYREQYEKILPKKDFKYYEIYNASEGFFAIQDLNNSSDLLLITEFFMNSYQWILLEHPNKKLFVYQMLYFSKTMLW
jgi:hypothetical protein